MNIKDKIRFELKYTVSGENDCWEWAGSYFSSGYGQFWCNNTNLKASRAAWMIYRGEIPKNMMVLHKCNNRKCVNINHLYLGDHLQNMKDREAAGRTSRGAHRYNFRRNEQLINDVIYMRCNGLLIKDICDNLNIGRTTYYRISSMIPAQENHDAKLANYKRAAGLRK